MPRLNMIRKLHKELLENGLIRDLGPIEELPTYQASYLEVNEEASSEPSNSVIEDIDDFQELNEEEVGYLI